MASYRTRERGEPMSSDYYGSIAGEIADDGPEGDWDDEDPAPHAAPGEQDPRGK